MSNGCYRCGALVGRHFEHEAWDVDAITLAEIPITISKRWLEALEQDGCAYGWAVFTFD